MKKQNETIKNRLVLSPDLTVETVFTRHTHPHNGVSLWIGYANKIKVEHRGGCEIVSTCPSEGTKLYPVGDAYVKAPARNTKEYRNWADRAYEAFLKLEPELIAFFTKDKCQCQKCGDYYTSSENSQGLCETCIKQIN